MPKKFLQIKVSIILCRIWPNNGLILCLLQGLHLDMIYLPGQNTATLTHIKFQMIPDPEWELCLARGANKG